MRLKNVEGSNSPTNCDVLSGEVAVQAQIDATGLTLKAKSRTMSALDRLLGGLLGIPAAYAEKYRKRVERSVDLEERNALLAISLEAQFPGERLEGVRLVVGQMIADELRKQTNREAVCFETVRSLRSLPPQEDPRLVDEGPDFLDNDWLNIFTSYSEKASSERLRQLLGRILSGEIRKPGKFAITTLRVISEMDAEIAKAFQEVASIRLLNGLLIKPHPLSSTFRNLGCVAEGVCQSLQESGRDLDDLRA